MDSTLHFLVDFDNIRLRPGPAKIQVEDIVEDIVRSVDASILAGFTRAEIRLYGGWYERNMTTPLAQTISAQLSRHFPKPLRVIQNGIISRLILNAELAYGSAFEPRFFLLNTYRQRSFPKGLRCHHPSDIGCTNPSCSALPLYQTFASGECRNSACHHRLDTLLYKGEQKLVDVMLALDLVHFSLLGHQTLCIVSSDEDFWPGIRAALYSGAKVIVIHTKPGYSSPQHYYQGYEDRLTETTL